MMLASWIPINLQIHSDHQSPAVVWQPPFQGQEDLHWIPSLWLFCCIFIIFCKNLKLVTIIANCSYFSTQLLFHFIIVECFPIHGDKANFAPPLPNILQVNNCHMAGNQLGHLETGSWLLTNHFCQFLHCRHSFVPQTKIVLVINLISITFFQILIEVCSSGFTLNSNNNFSWLFFLHFLLNFSSKFLQKRTQAAVFFATTLPVLASVVDLYSWKPCSIFWLWWVNGFEWAWGPDGFQGCCWWPKNKYCDANMLHLAKLEKIIKPKE